jgi:hypothetical protein
MFDPGLAFIVGIALGAMLGVVVLMLIQSNNEMKKIEEQYKKDTEIMELKHYIRQEISLAMTTPKYKKEDD